MATPHDIRTQLTDDELAFFKTAQGKKVLEVFCGNAKNLLKLSSLGFSVAGIDEPVRAEKLPAATRKKMAITCHAIFNAALPYDTQFDIVYCYQYLNHSFKYTIEDVIKEMHRVLKKDGVVSIIISDMDQFKLRHVTKKLYEETDPAFPKILYEKVAEQTFVKKEGEEKGVPHYGFYAKELESTLHKIGFHDITVTKKTWNLVAHARK